MKNSFRITVNGTVEVSLLQTPKPLFTFVQTSPKLLAKLSLLSTNIPRNFVVEERKNFVLFIAITGNWVWEELEKTAGKDFEIYNDNLLKGSYWTTSCNSALILASIPERDLSLTYNVLSSAAWINFKSSLQVLKSFM